MIANFELPQRSLPYLNAILALCVGFLFFYSIWRWHSDWMIAHPSNTTSMKVNHTDELTTLIATIPDNHLFGKSFNQSGDVPITDLELRVTGIVKVNQEHPDSTSKVYISSSGQPSKIYQIGDTLPHGVKVYEITEDAVILENSGHLEKLPLPREQLHFKPAPTQEPS